MGKGKPDIKLGGERDGAGSGERGSISCEIVDFCSPESEVKYESVGLDKG